MANAVFCFSPSLLVFGNTSGFFKVVTQIFRLGFNKTGNHPLFDNGVTARPQPGTEKNIRDITSPAAAAIEEIDGTTLT